MTYKVYMTIELPERCASTEDAMDAAVKELQDAVQRQVICLCGGLTVFVSFHAPLVLGHR